jgi:hypothetical protein
MPLFSLLKQKKASLMWGEKLVIFFYILYLNIFFCFDLGVGIKQFRGIIIYSKLHCRSFIISLALDDIRESDLIQQFLLIFQISLRPDDDFLSLLFVVIDHVDDLLIELLFSIVVQCPIPIDEYSFKSRSFGQCLCTDIFVCVQNSLEIIFSRQIFEARMLKLEQSDHFGFERDPFFRLLFLW